MQVKQQTDVNDPLKVIHFDWIGLNIGEIDLCIFGTLCIVHGNKKSYVAMNKM